MLELNLNYLACAVCFGDPASPLTDGLVKGVLSLFIVVSCVLLLFARFFLNCIKRSKGRSAQGPGDHVSFVRKPYGKSVSDASVMVGRGQRH
jgi:hypothetical protein